MWWFAAGTITGVYLFGKSPSAWVLAGIALVLARPGCVRSPVPAVVAVALSALGGVHGALSVERALERRLPAIQADQVFRLEGRIADLPERRVEAGLDGAPRVVQRFVLTLEREVDGWPRGRRVTLGHVAAPGFELAAGDRVIVLARLRPPRGLVNEGGLDGERMALARGIDARGRVETVLRRAPGADRLALWRARLAAAVAAPVQGAARAILPALVAGDRRGLTPDHWHLLQRTGTAHLVAISGLHVSLVAGGVWLMMRGLLTLLLLPWPGAPRPHTLAIFPALAAAGGYVVLAGLALPAQRALLMGCWAMLAAATGRRASLGVVTGRVLAAMLLLDPLAALEGGFWLSFLAVAVLAALLQGRLGVVPAQLLLSLATGALAGWLFGVWSLWSAAMNLVMVPLYTLAIIPLALAGAVLMQPPLLEAAGWLVNAGWALLAHTGAWPLLPPVPGFAALLALQLLSWRWGAGGMPGPFWSLSLLLLPWCWPADTPPAPGEFDLVMFDVGQGQMSAVRTRHHLVVYDTGPRWHAGSPVSAILLPWAERRRLRPDLVFVSHGDADHDGGLADARRLWPAAAVFSGEPERTGGVLCLAGQRWWLDGVLLEVIWPEPLPLRHSNNRSCVLRIVGRAGSVLLTGDIERPVEFRLALDAPRADLLQVPHHGSGTSSSHAFLHAVAPRAATAGNGYLNRFGHPAAHIRARYRTLGIPLYNTAETGMQWWRFRDGHSLRPVCWRHRSRWPWRLPGPVIE